MTPSPTRAVVFAGGALHTTPSIGARDLVIAADSGYDHAVALDVRVDVLVGDLDSVSPAGMEHARRASVDIHEYAPDKDATDLELALRIAADRGVTTVDLHGGENGRIDHLLGIALSISHSDWDSIDIAWHTRTGLVQCATRTRPLSAHASIGDIISLIPVGDALGVTTTGLRWQLDLSVLERGATRGVSNEAILETITVSVQEGAVLVIQNTVATP